MNTIHSLTAVDDARGIYSHVRCVRCHQEFRTPMNASRVPCAGEKEITHAPAG